MNILRIPPKVQGVSMIRWSILILSSIVLAGCAYTTAKPYYAADADHVRGLKIPDMRPLLVVANSQVSVVMVPNPDRGVALRFGAFLAKNDCEVDLDHQSVTKFHCVEDSTALPVELVKVLENAATEKLPLGQLFAAQVSGDRGTAKLQIFAVDFGDNGQIVGLKPLLSNESSFIEVPATPNTGTVPPPPVPDASPKSGGGTPQNPN